MYVYISIVSLVIAGTVLICYVVRKAIKKGDIKKAIEMTERIFSESDESRKRAEASLKEIKKENVYPFNQKYEGTKEGFYKKILEDLRVSGWQISDTSNTVEKLIKCPLIIVKPPNADCWQLRALILEKRR